MEWSEHHTAILKRRWNEGASASVIGAELGMTRNAVLGRAWRIGLGKRRNAYAPKKKRVQSLRKPPTPRVRAPRPSIFDFVGPMLPADWCPKPVDMVEMTRNQCRWPVGEPHRMQFCGELKFGDHVYCERHCRMAYRPNRRAA